MLAEKAGFSAEDFIEMVQKDETFYEAFKNLRRTRYDQETTMQFEDGRKGIVTYESTLVQSLDAGCRVLKVKKETFSDRYYKGKRQKNRYYTSALYHRLFGQTGRYCQTELVNQVKATERSMEEHVDAMKQLIFSPGQPADIPFMSSKTAIFSEKMHDRYTFHIRSQLYENVHPAYVFEVRLKPEYNSGGDNRTLIKSMTTWFSKDDFQVLGRTYQLSQKALFYSFDVEMDIQLTKTEGLYVPERIRYKGWWNIPTKRKEEGQFSIHFTFY